MKYPSAVLICLVLAGVLLAGLPSAIVADAQLKLPIFRTPIQVPSTLVNTGTEMAPTITGDDLTMYFASSRAGGLGGYDIWMVTRLDLASPWGNLTNVQSLNSTAAESYLDVRDDGLEMYISTARTGGSGANDIWMASRASNTAPWGTPVVLPGANTASSEDDPSVTGDGLELYYVSPALGGQGGGSIFRLTRTSIKSPWSTKPVLVSELDSTSQDHSPAISPDGLTILWSSTRPGGTGSSDFYIATRPDRNSQFTNVQEAKELNTTLWDHNGQWSADGFSFYFGYNQSYMVYRADRILPLCIVDGAQPYLPGVNLIKIGQSFFVSCRRDPGDIGIIVGSAGNIPPISLPGIQGQLELNLGLMFLPPMIGFVSKMGRFSVPLAVPNEPRLNGLRLHFQAAAQDQTSPPQAYISNRVELVVLK